MRVDEEKPKAAGECGPCSPSLRNRYFRGKLLTVADYEAEQRYMIRRRRLVNRSVLGWGVISGFAVTVEDGHLHVGPGVAFDDHGRELVACEETRLCSDGDLLWLKPGACGCGETIEPAAGRYLLSAHYAERKIDGVRVDDGCGEASCEWNHVCETVLFALTPIKECPCGRPDCRGCGNPTDCSALALGKGTESAGPAADPEKAAAWDDRGPHATLCEWSRDWLCDHDPCGKERLCLQNGYWIDPEAGVPLACVTVDADDCGKLVYTVDSDCHPRRLVRPNDALFDLIRGCDLTRIQSIGWDDRSGEMTPDEFYALFVEPKEAPERPKRRSEHVDYPPVDTGFTICFTGPVQIASLTPDVMTITLVQRHPNERLGVVFRVPIEKLWILPTQDGDPPDTTRGFRPMVSWQFWDGEINPDAVSGFERPTIVEIEVRGDFILDWRGQSVDANRVGRHRWPTGNGTPGGSFLSSFTVQRAAGEPTVVTDQSKVAQSI